MKKLAVGFSLALLAACSAGAPASSPGLRDTTVDDLLDEVDTVDTGVGLSDASVPDDVAVAQAPPLDSNLVDSVVHDSVRLDAQSLLAFGDGGDALCDPTEPPDPTGGLIYASSTNGSDTGDGTAAKPFKTIAKAMATAKQQHVGRILLDAGKYAEQVTFADADPGITLEGGWKQASAGWGRNCSAKASAETTIASPAAIGVVAQNLQNPAGLKQLTVQTKPKGASASDTSGESVIGILVNGGAFTLDHVNVAAGDGGAGGQVTAPAAPAAATAQLTGDQCSDGADGANGNDGAAAAGIGVFGATGYTPADGAPGAAGAAGHAGTKGGDAQRKPCVTACAAPPSTCKGQCNANFAQVSGAAGLCGGGGAPGAAGPVGRGGGASVGVLAASSSTQVSLIVSAITAGQGGTASTGESSDGGAGADGASGTAVACPDDCSLTTSCECKPTVGTPIPGGSAGGTGGKGGRGGKGGDGFGGPSYGIVLVGGATWTHDDASKVTPGQGGANPKGVAAPAKDVATF